MIVKYTNILDIAATRIASDNGFLYLECNLVSHNIIIKGNITSKVKRKKILLLEVTKNTPVLNYMKIVLLLIKHLRSVVLFNY